MSRELSPNKIKKLISDAEKLSPYLPNTEVNQFFGSLYKLAKDQDSYLPPETKESGLLKHLNKICSDAEAQMEHYRSERIINSSNPKLELQQFPYRDNYQSLTSLEYHLTISQIGTVNKALFVGSGALPLTAIILAEKRGIHCTLVDIDEKAVKTSSKLLDKLQLTEKIQVIHSDFLNFCSREKYDVVFLASLLFNGSRCDQCILEHLGKCLNFGVAILRSAKGNRKLLYQKLDIQLIKKYLNLQLILHPQNDIINSILLCSKLK